MDHSLAKDLLEVAGFEGLEQIERTNLAVGFPDGHYHQRHAGTPQGGALDIKGILEKSWWIAVGVQPADKLHRRLPQNKHICCPLAAGCEVVVVVQSITSSMKHDLDVAYNFLTERSTDWPSRPRGNDDDEVIVVADDADAAWPESPGLDDGDEEEPREYTFEVAVEGKEAEEDQAEKEKKDDGENGDNNEKDEVQEAVEQQVEDTEEGGDVGEDEKKEADHMMEADSDDERGAIRSMRQEQAKAQKRDPVMHLDSQGVYEILVDRNIDEVTVLLFFQLTAFGAAGRLRQCRMLNKMLFRPESQYDDAQWLRHCAEKEKKDDGENGDNNEKDEVQEAVEQQVEDTEEGGDVGEDEKKEADHMMEADSDDERGAIRYEILVDRNIDEVTVLLFFQLTAFGAAGRLRQCRMLNKMLFRPESQYDDAQWLRHCVRNMAALQKNLLPDSWG
eukprot:symbB.v1.2.025083.t1/scaffold2313.1/size127079/4